MTSSKPDHPLKFHLLTPSHWGVGFRHRNLGADTNISSITYSKAKGKRIRLQLERFSYGQICDNLNIKSNDNNRL